MTEGMMLKTELEHICSLWGGISNYQIESITLAVCWFIA